MTTQPEALRLADELSKSHLNHHINHAAAAELRRLHRHETACVEWLEKTAWLQETARPDELGMHRADAMLQRLEKVEAQRDALLEALKLARSIIGHPDDAHSQMIDAAIKAVEGE